MKLAEGLALRADAARRVEQLRSRIAGSARYQEGEEPPEDAAALLAEAGAALDQLQILIRRINRTNAAAQIGADGTITDALARPALRTGDRARHTPHHRVQIRGDEGGTGDLHPRTTVNTTAAGRAHARPGNSAPSPGEPALSA